MGYAGERGDVYRMIYGVDSFGNVCGVDNSGDPINNTNLDLRSFKYLYYADPTDGDAPAICVEKCPYYESSTFTADINGCSQCTASSTAGQSEPCGSCVEYSTCVSSLGTSPYTYYDAIRWVNSTNNNGCAPYSYSTKPVINRCFPSADSYPSTNVTQGGSVTEGFANQINSIEYTTTLYEFFFSSRYQLLYSGLAALGATMVLVLLLRLLVGPIVWALIVSTILVALGATWMLWNEYFVFRDDIDDKEDAGGQATEAEENNRDYYLAGSILASIFSVILLVIVVAMRNRIKLAIAIFEEASRALADRPILFLTPFFTYAWLLGFLVLWVYVSLLLLTMEDKVYHEDTGYYSYEWGSDPNEDEWNFILVYHVFALLWIAQFIIAAGNFVISGTTVSWYFTHERPAEFFKKDPRAHGHGHDGYIHAVWVLLRYHLGSVALGSLIIAIIQAIRLVVEYIDHKFRPQIEKSAVARFVMCACKCCLWCLEKVMKYINKNAYIITNIHGHNFCRAAYISFMDLLHNAGLVFVINSVGFLIIFLCKVLISLGTALFCYMLLETGNEGQSSSDNYGSWLIILFAAFIGWLVATAFLELYSTIVDTVALCFMEDKKYNDNSDGKEPAAGPKLRKFMVKVCTHHPELDAKAIRHPSTGNIEGPLPASNSDRDAEKSKQYSMRVSQV